MNCFAFKTINDDIYTFVKDFIKTYKPPKMCPPGK